MGESDKAEVDNASKVPSTERLSRRKVWTSVDEETSF